jgi:hypothetical protein
VPTGSHAERNEAIAAARRAGASLQALADEHGLSAQRVGQIVARAEGRPPSRGTRSRSDGERVRLRIANLSKAVLVTGQAYQDPKDALNEFVSNAADEYAQSGVRGERIRVVLRRKGKRPVIAVDDDGRGMSPDRLRELARNLFESTKAGDDRTLGEKAIGLLAFQQLGGRCEIVSRADGSDETWALRLERGRVDAELARDRRRARQAPGTTVYLSEIDPEVLRVLTQRKVVDYLRRRRGPALERGDYVLEVIEGRSSELVTAEEPDGVRLEIPPRSTLWGRIDVALFVAPNVDRSRHVAVVGRAGTVILDDLAELEEFEHEPWTSGHVSGQIVFEALQQSAGRRAVLRDRDAFPLFRDAVESIEPSITKAVAKVRKDVDEATADRLADTLRQVFGKVLKELADLDNPMRTSYGTEPGEGGLFDAGSDRGPVEDRGAPDNGPRSSAEDTDPTIDDLLPDEQRPPTSDARPDGERSKTRNLPSVAVDPDPGYTRSRFDADAGVVLYNDGHADYLQVKDDERALLDYLATLVAKEYVVYNNPRSAPDELGEELVRILIRVRRHLGRRR